MKIIPMASTPKTGPWCQHQVHVAAGANTCTARHRAYLTKKKGIPIDHCGTQASFSADDKPLCRAHAGAVALAAVLATNE